MPQLAAGIRDIYSQLATNPALAAVPVWLTENNVNADYDQGNGSSTLAYGRISATMCSGAVASSISSIWAKNVGIRPFF